MVNLRAMVAAAAIAVAVGVATVDHAGTVAIAAPVPTPAPGAAQPIPQPTPVNPVQYIVTPGSIGSSAAQNSNFYKVYGDLSGVVNALNGCNYIPGAAIGAISATSPLNVSITTCSSGTGTGATATISLGGVVPMANTFPTPAFSYTTSAAGGSTAGVQPPVYAANGTITSQSEHIVRGTITVTVPNASTTSVTSATVTLSGAAAFSAAGSYVVVASLQYGASTIPPGWNSNITVHDYNQSAGSFTIFASDAPAASTAAGGSLVLNYVAIGY